MVEKKEIVEKNIIEKKEMVEQGIQNKRTEIRNAVDRIKKLGRTTQEDVAATSEPIIEEPTEKNTQQ